MRRFALVYFSLFCLTTQVFTCMLAIPVRWFYLPDLCQLWPLRDLIFAVAHHVFGATLPLVYIGSNSGDKIFDWVLIFCLLIFSLLLTLLWNQIDPKSSRPFQLEKWLQFFLKLGLTSQLIYYGLIKLIPWQMPFPNLTRLVTNFGQFTPMGVLWSSIGASPGYEMFVGAAELLAGLLLLFPRTAVLGALIGLADMTEVFVLNMAYDVPVKMIAFHLILLSILVLLPQMKSLFDFFFVRGQASLIPENQVFPDTGKQNWLPRLQLAFGAWLLFSNLYMGYQYWNDLGGNRTKSPLYGIWNITQMKVDNIEIPPLLTDTRRWRRLIFDFPDQASIQEMDDSMKSRSILFHESEQSFEIYDPQNPQQKDSFHYQNLPDGHLRLDGTDQNHQLHLELKAMDLQQFPLIRWGFHWQQEEPSDLRPSL